jgi:4'-phosphopantetheinyl transferase
MSNPIVHINHIENINWLDGMECGYAVDNSSDIWRISINSNIQYIGVLGDLLNADEHERAKRYYREKDKQRFIISRAALRILLGRYLNTDAKLIAFEIGENNKPHVKGGFSLHYNVSHSGDQILIAVSDLEVGVDVEQPDLEIHYQDIINISYSKPESDLVNGSAEPLQAFYLLWTRKEALLKATAKGIDDGLKFIPSIDGTHLTMYNTIGSDKNWRVQSFKVDGNHTGAIASQSSKNSFWNFEWGFADR